MEIKSVCAIIRRSPSAVVAVSREWEGATCWTLPGGKVEPGESPEDAIKREIREETGLNLLAVRPVYTGMCIDEDWLCRCYDAGYVFGDMHTAEDHEIDVVATGELGGPFMQYYRDVDEATSLLSLRTPVEGV